MLKPLKNPYGDESIDHFWLSASTNRRHIRDRNASTTQTYRVVSQRPPAFLHRLKQVVLYEIQCEIILTPSFTVNC